MGGPGRQIDVPMMQVQAQPSNGLDQPGRYQMVLAMAIRPQNTITLSPNPNPTSLPESESRLSQTSGYSRIKKGRDLIFIPATPDQTPPQKRNARTVSANRGTPSDHPPSKRRRRNELNPATRQMLTARRPLRNSDDIHRDIWRHILTYCDPKFLLRAKTVSKMMYAILTTSQAIWRKSREVHLPESPPCPSHLTEQQYVDLLVGRGCQVPSCFKKNVISVAWPFLGRVCVDCLYQRVVKIDDIPPDHDHTVGMDHLYTALPIGRILTNRRISACWMDADGRYLLTGKGQVVLKSDWQKLQSEYLEVASHHDQPLLEEWFITKRADVVQYMKEIKKLERFSYSQAFQYKGSTREARRRLFTEEAARLTPPISEEMLEMMTAYQKALDTGNAPSHRAWLTLKAKIVPYRERAEELQKLLKDTAIRQAQRSSPEEKDMYKKIADERKCRLQQPKQYLPEQEFVIDIGKEEYAKCLSNGVADCDLLLLTLKNVFDRYDGIVSRRSSPRSDDGSAPHPISVLDAVAITRTPLRPIGLNYDGERGPYVLSMDDAVMIIQEVLEPAIGKASCRGKEVYHSLRCIACSSLGNKYTRDFDFQHGLEHVRNEHGSEVGDAGEFWRYMLQPNASGGDYGYDYMNFPFFTTPWSRCLPLVPKHRDATALQGWHPDNDWLYVQAPKKPSISVFDGRQVQNHDPTRCSGLLDMFKHAIGILRGIRLSNRAITRIALQYVSDSGAGNDDCSLNDFIVAIPSFKEANPALDFKYMCGICMTDDANRFDGVHTKHCISVQQLQIHWQKKHAKSNLDWKTNFMYLPSDSELLEEIMDSDAKLQREKDEIMAFAAQEYRCPSLRKKPNPKANAILGIRPSISVFDQLFPTTKETRRGVMAALG